MFGRILGCDARALPPYCFLARDTEGVSRMEEKTTQSSMEEAACATPHNKHGVRLFLDRNAEEDDNEEDTMAAANPAKSFWQWRRAPRTAVCSLRLPCSCDLARFVLTSKVNTVVHSE